MNLLTFDEGAHDVNLYSPAKFEANSIVVSYNLMITSQLSIKVLLSDPTSTRKVLKTKKILRYQKELYGYNRMTIKSRDGKTELIRVRMESSRHPIPLSFWLKT